VSVRPIVLFGDPVLRTPAEEVVDFDRQLRRLVNDLTDSMIKENGAGLAAPQLGVGLRVFTYDIDDTLGHLVNPVLEFPDDEEQDGPEGCLSIPGLYYDTRRRLNTVARGVDLHGEPVQIVGTELMARCLQHETDHLDGILFVDRLDPETRTLALAEIRDAEWNAPPPEIRQSPHPLLGKIR
jgi:peptide deformylase